MPLPKPSSSKSVSRRLQKSIPLLLHPPPPDSSHHPPKLILPPPPPPSASLPKDRLVRVICTDPDATDSSSDDDDYDDCEDFDHQASETALGGYGRKRLVREICLPSASCGEAVGFLRSCGRGGDSVAPSKLPRRGKERESSADSLREPAQGPDCCSDGFLPFGSDLLLLPDGEIWSGWQKDWMLPEDDIFLSEVDLELDSEQISSWFDSLQRHA